MEWFQSINLKVKNDWAVGLHAYIYMAFQSLERKKNIKGKKLYTFKQPEVTKRRT